MAGNLFGAKGNGFLFPVRLGKSDSCSDDGSNVGGSDGSVMWRLIREVVMRDFLAQISIRPNEPEKR